MEEKIPANSMVIHFSIYLRMTKYIYTYIYIHIYIHIIQSTLDMIFLCRG